MVYYPDRNDDIEGKRRHAQEFLDHPSRGTFTALVGDDGLWATEPRRNIHHYVDNIVFAEQTPEEVAAVVERAVEDPDALEDVLALDGFGWATATELLHVLAPDTYAILNKRAVAGMEALGYDTPSRQTASVEEYWDFVGNVEDAIGQYDLRELVNESTETPDVPEDHTDLEAADAAFNAHYDDDAENFDLRAIREAQVAETQLNVPEELWELVEEKVANTATYRDVEDFIYSAIRNELNRG